MPLETNNENAGDNHRRKRGGLFIYVVVVAISSILVVILWRYGNSEPIFSRHKLNPVDAAAIGDLNLLKQLESQGISLDSQDPHMFNETALIAAVLDYKTNVVEYLLQRKVNLNLMDNSGGTALIWAVSSGDTNIVKMLLEHGAQSSFRDPHGNTAYGAVKGNVDMLNLLKSYDNKQDNGKTN
jgi:ankyrin repeat protein